GWDDQRQHPGVRVDGPGKRTDHPGRTPGHGRAVLLEVELLKEQGRPAEGPRPGDVDRRPGHGRGAGDDHRCTHDRGESHRVLPTDANVVRLSRRYHATTRRTTGIAPLAAHRRRDGFVPPPEAARLIPCRCPTASATSATCSIPRRPTRIST